MKTLKYSELAMLLWKAGYRPDTWKEMQEKHNLTPDQLRNVLAWFDMWQDDLWTYEEMLREDLLDLRGMDE